MISIGCGSHISKLIKQRCYINTGAASVCIAEWDKVMNDVIHYPATGQHPPKVIYTFVTQLVRMLLQCVPSLLQALLISNGSKT